MHTERVDAEGVDKFCEFAREELKIVNPDTGLMEFELFDYQKELVNVYENERFVIVRKFRNGGFTTTTLAYLFWKCLSNPNIKVGVFSSTTAQAVHCMKLVRRFIANLPDSPENFDFGENDIEFKDTGSKMYFRNASCNNCRGCKLDYAMLDEAAYCKDAEGVWKALYPALGDEGKAFVVSSVNGKQNLYMGAAMPNWFYETYRSAFQGENSFVTFDVDYTKNPKNTPEYIAELHKTLGDLPFREEVLCQFLNVKDVATPVSCDLSVEPVEGKEFYDCQGQSYDSCVVEQIDIRMSRNTSTEREPVSKELGAELERLAGIKDEMPKPKKKVQSKPFGFRTVSHPEFPEEPNWDLQDLKEIWEDIADHIPAYKGVARELRKKCQNQHIEDVSVIRDQAPRTTCEDVKLSGLDCKGDPRVVTLQTQLIDKIMEDDSLPREMDITITDRAVEINGVPTQISGKAVEYLFKGYVGLADEETAITETAQILRARLQKLF